MILQVGFQNTINRMIQKLSCAEQKITALESSCIDKGKKIDELEDQIQVMLKDKEVGYKLPLVMCESDADHSPSKDERISKGIHEMSSFISFGLIT